MKIKEFVERYERNNTNELKEEFLKKNLQVKTYIPFLKKDALAKIIMDRSTYKFKICTKEDGTIGSEKSDNIEINSVAQYILFCRVIIENYTNLEVETDGFFEEYDALKQSGLLDILIVGNENTLSLIPPDEINEIRMLVDMKQKDEIFNRTEIHNYISEQIDKLISFVKTIPEIDDDKSIDDTVNNIDKEIN